MNTYTLLTDWNGLTKGLEVFGPYLITGSTSKGYVTKENIPTTPEGTSNAIFASVVENSPEIFAEVKQ